MSSSSSKNPRDHGLGIHGRPVGPPRVSRALPGPEATCPHCGCEGLYEVSVRMTGVRILAGGEGKGKYLGCAACPWAGPMVVVADIATADA